MPENPCLSTFATEVQKGLSSKPKYLPSWMFYDDCGDDLFRKIMKMPAYYLADCEIEIFKDQGNAILTALAEQNQPFDLVELGAGDGTKTEILLKKWLNNGHDIRYFPIDISPHVLNLLEVRLRNKMPGLKIKSTAKTFESALENIEISEYNRVFLFLGSNIGNMNIVAGIDFLKKIRSRMKETDRLFVGFDMQKDPEVILKAYNDPEGITADFNLNLLDRLNRELGAEFQRQNFSHYPFYDPGKGQATSYLVSRKKHCVSISALNRKFSFDQWELIHTEISTKYSGPGIESMAAGAGLEVDCYFQDKRAYYRNVIFKPI